MVRPQALTTSFDSYQGNLHMLQAKKKKGSFFSARDQFVATLQQTIKDILDRDCNPARASAPAAWNEHDVSKYSD